MTSFGDDIYCKSINGEAVSSGGFSNAPAVHSSSATNLGFYLKTAGTTLPTKVTAPTASPGASYVQAEVVALYTAINEIITKLEALGLVAA